MGITIFLELITRYIPRFMDELTILKTTCHHEKLTVFTIIIQKLQVVFPTTESTIEPAFPENSRPNFNAHKRLIWRKGERRIYVQF